MSHFIDLDGSLFEQLRPRMKAISCRIVGSDAEAEDIVQDCFLKWQSMQQTVLVTPVAWLTTVVQHQSIDRLRQRAREAAAALTALEMAPDVSPVLPELHLLRRAELGEALACLLARLSPSERMALVLHEVFDYSHAEIAAVLGTTAVNARQYLARARRRLREERRESESLPERAAATGEKLCRELIRRFQDAIHGVDVPVLLALLVEAQPVSVHTASVLRIHSRQGANDASYSTALMA